MKKPSFHSSFGGDMSAIGSVAGWHAEDHPGERRDDAS